MVLYRRVKMKLFLASVGLTTDTLLTAFRALRPMKVRSMTCEVRRLLRSQ
ncbi:MAG: hypothetical protein ACK5GN_00360 [Pseudomonadota bacterium]